MALVRTALLLAVGLLVSLGGTASTLGVWAHRSALSDDGWADLATKVLADPEVAAGTSRILGHRLSEALDPADRATGSMAGRGALVPGEIVVPTEEQLVDGIAGLLASDGFRAAWRAGNQALHGIALATLRDGSGVVSVSERSLLLDPLPLVTASLALLETGGLLPRTAGLSGVSRLSGGTGLADTLLSGAARALDRTLGRQPREDAAAMTLVEAPAIGDLQRVVRAADLLVAGLVGLSLALAGVALLLARRRWRSLGWLALSVVVGLAVVRLGAPQVLGGQAGASVRGAEVEVLSAVVRVVAEDAMGFVLLALLGFALAGIGALAMSVDAEALARASRGPGGRRSVRALDAED
jgi:hypothetical protein